MSSFKRLILIIVLMILVGVMTGCGDNKKMVELENAIGDLQSSVNEFKDEKKKYYSFNILYADCPICGKDE